MNAMGVNMHANGNGVGVNMSGSENPSHLTNGYRGYHGQDSTLPSANGLVNSGMGVVNGEMNGQSLVSGQTNMTAMGNNIHANASGLNFTNPGKGAVMSTN